MNKPLWRAVENLDLGTNLVWTSNMLYRCDPYLVWSDATTTTDPHDALDIGVLIELDSADEIPELMDIGNAGRGNPGLRYFLPNGFEPPNGSQFITGLVNRRGLELLVSLVVAKRVKRFSLQESRKDIADTTKAMFELYERERIANKRADVPLRHEEAEKPLPPDPQAGPGTYLGIIDDGLPVLRIRPEIQFLDKPAHLWDQGWEPRYPRPTHVKPSPEPDDEYWQIAWEFLLGWAYDPNISLLPFLKEGRGFFYGRRLKRMPASGAGENDRDEYFLSRYFTPAPRQTHGAGVLGLLAPWLSGARSKVKWPDYISGLAMVQLPTVTVADTSGGSLAMRVIDGLRYILWQESKDRADARANDFIVVNVSYGVHAGPHDGSSMFERAIEEMLCANPRLRLVLPAGNAAQVGCHAHRALAAAGKEGDTQGMALQVLPDNDRDTFVEIWLPRSANVEVRIRPPGSGMAYAVRQGDAKVHYDARAAHPDQRRQVHFGAVYAPEVAQGENGTMVLVAIGATRVGLGRDDGASGALQPRGLNRRPRIDVLGASGLWELQVRNLASGPVAIDAWIERDDAPPDLPGGSRQAWFPDSCREEVRLGNATPESTLNGIATLQHEHLRVVGAMRADGPLATYSAAGPARPPGLRDAPDVVAPADYRKAVPGLRTIGFVLGAITRINGTSAACAVYARALAKQLTNNPSLPPTAPLPADPPPEVTCVTDSGPEADPRRRGKDQRMLFEFDIDL